MWDLRFQNCFSPTPLTSTILVEVTIGVSGFGRESDEHRGMTKLSKFSYKANRFRRRAGIVDDLWLSGVPVDMVSLYAAISLLFRWRISKT
jgi:hypothetical protein